MISELKRENGTEKSEDVGKWRKGRSAAKKKVRVIERWTRVIS